MHISSSIVTELQEARLQVRQMQAWRQGRTVRSLARMIAQDWALYQARIHKNVTATTKGLSSSLPPSLFGDKRRVSKKNRYYFLWSINDFLGLFDIPGVQVKFPE